MSRSNRINKKVPRPRTAEEFRALAHQILQYASRGVLRINFQQEVSKMILEFSGCDAVELWLKEHGKYFRCQAKRKPPQSFSFEITSFIKNENDEIFPDTDDNHAQGYPCQDVFLVHPELSHLVFSKNESFWTGDIKKIFPLPLPPARKSRGQGCDLRGDYRSLALIPLLVENQNIGLFQLKSKGRNFFTEDDIKLYEGLAQSLGIALAHRLAQSDLRERVKELTCLYGIARLVAQPNLSVEEILQNIVELLPPAWLYPEIAFARIILDGRSYSIPHFKEGNHRLIADIVVSGKKRGIVEVIYGEEKTELDEGPFLQEERNLIDTVAREVAIIIKRREAEDDQLKLQEQLRHADRLATIGQLAAGVAHELNEPLGNILGFTQLAQKCLGLPQQARQDIEKILSASLNAREVVKKLLIFARQMPPRMTKVNLTQLVEDGLHFFESRCAKEGIELIRLLSPDLPEIAADPAQLNQVLVNLIVNALQAMPEGGKLRVKTLASKDYVSLVVEDAGIGMSEEILKKVFIPFFTTKDVGQGTGLGLPVVHGIVSSHGGTIQVESRLGRGTRFEIRLPVKGSQSVEEMK